MRHGALKVNAHQETSVPRLVGSGRCRERVKSPLRKVLLRLPTFTTNCGRRPILSALTDNMYLNLAMDGALRPGRSFNAFR